MYKAVESPMQAENSIATVDQANPIQTETVRRDWVSEAAGAVYEQIKAHPVETGAVGLIASIALSKKLPAFEEMLGAATGLAKNAARSGSGVPFVRAGRGLEAEASVVADSTFASPWARTAVQDAGAVAKDAGAVVAKDAGKVAKEAGEAVADSKTAALPDALIDKIPDFSGMNFSRFAPKQLRRDTVAIPTISVDAFKIGQPFTQEAFKVIPKASAEAHLYKSAKDATVRVWSKDGVGSGFFVDQHHIATANHVLNGRTGLVTIELATGKAIPARVVARDVAADTALLRIEEPFKRAMPFEFASAREVRTGMHGYLIGHPHGTVEKVLTKGRITGMSVDSGTALGTVTHTAESVTGMSGAPLLLENRKVLGILQSGPSTLGTAFDGQAAHIRHIRPPLDYVRKVLNPDGIDWHTYADMTKNSRNMPKISISGRREISQG